MEPVDEGEQIKEVYAHFGLALYLSQVLEHGLANALLLFDLVPNARKVATPESWPEIVDAFYEKKFERTLGALIAELKKYSGVTDSLNNILTKALKERNRLAHHYFRERAKEFISSIGREKMITELQESQRLFENADKDLEIILAPIREQYGYSKDTIESSIQTMMDESKNDY